MKTVIEMKEEILKKLDDLSIPYEKVEHPSIDTMEGLAGVEEKLGYRIAKNLFLCNRQKTKFYLLLMPGDKKFKTKELSKQINSARLSFGSDEDMERLLGCKPGSASILGLFNDVNHQVRLLIDDDLLKDDYFCMHPCDNTMTLKIKKEDLFGIFLPSVHVDYTAVHLVGE